MEFTWLFAALPEFRNWFTFLYNERKEGQKVDAREEEAVAALYLALNETQIYIGSMQRKEAESHGVIRDYEVEAKLSRLWTDASLKTRRYDPDMSERLRKKGEYWANPDMWTADDVKRARIQITQVLDSARGLIGGDSKP